MDTQSQDWQSQYRNYWTIAILKSTGRSALKDLPQTQSWFQSNFEKKIKNEFISERQLQEECVALYRNGGTDEKTHENTRFSQLSLRSYISHQIRYACFQLAEKFGERHNFTAANLFPFVLDDQGHLNPNYRPFSLEILDNYKSDRAQLNTWSVLRTKNHKELNRYLLSHNLYRATDWSILNSTTTDQLKDILYEYFHDAPSETERNCQRLANYHQVYKLDRIQQGLKGLCPPPTPQQLMRMDPDQPPEATLEELKTLATRLRQYCIHVRAGHPDIYDSDYAHWEDALNQKTVSAEPVDDEHREFLDSFGKILQDSLNTSIFQALQNNIERLNKKKPQKVNAYIKGLKLFHQEGMSMGKIAPLIGLSSQVQVNRLLNLKSLRTQVCHLLIPQLKAKVTDQALNYTSAEQLLKMNQNIDQALSNIVETMVKEAAAEAQSPKGRTAKSLFAHQLCQTLQQFTLEQ